VSDDDPDYRVDSSGKRRRLCDMPCRGAASYHEPKGRRCVEYARRQLPDGGWVCTGHDPDRKAGWFVCSQPVEWDEQSRPSRTCAHRGRWLFNDAVDGDPPRWRWYCRTHDPDGPRCENPGAHPPGPYFQREIAAGRIEVSKGGPKVCPRSPHATRLLFGIRLCPDCAQPGKARVRATAEPREVRPPCCLCGGTACLEDDAGRFFPCLCTPGGRELANGGLNDAQVAACLAADCTVAFVLAQRAG
jgi:hypothetical protein